MQGVKRFGLRGSLVLLMLDHIRFWIGLAIAYRVALPPRFAGVHNVFYVFSLRKYIPNSTYVLQCELPELRDSMTCGVPTLHIAREEKKELRNRAIPYVKVQWSNRKERSYVGACERNAQQVSLPLPRVLLRYDFKFRGRSFF